MTTEILSMTSQHARSVSAPVSAPAAVAEHPAVQAKAETSAADRQTHEQTRANIREAVDRINRQMKDTNRDLNFSVDDASDRVVITVKSTSTGEVIRQIPDQALLRVAHNIEDIKGLLHNAST